MTDPPQQVRAPLPLADQPFAVTERTQTQLVLRRFLRHRLAVLSLLVFVLIVLFAFVGPLLWKYTYFTSTPDNSQPPSLTHPFGTTGDGKDLLALVMRGTQQSVKISLLIAVVSTAFGTIWGAAAGYFRGVVDAVLMRIADLVIILPILAVAAVLANSSDGAWWMVSLVIAGLVWSHVARVVRGVVLSLREREFVEAARALGATDARIIFRHLVPNAIGPIIVAATVLVASGILIETALSFLGFGVQPPDTSLGILISEARTAVQTRPWLFYFPGLFIILIALCVNFIGDGLRDALDPKQTRVRQ
ncbi:ABC transporter permease [Nonomuraea jiangxiensis]|uniref:Oligopeptide transport system permease protein OppC n=1 Tax=Nonomuraea jiangxiensis TaxID=633440 RepID=A0A1G9BBL7_9ACTN|nr:ABC transporter permease [Nonomuraea jiangxiensis]SDK36918.1 peptide/nickel transport system permease protein [Nonomuraea jiangxiensis]